MQKPNNYDTTQAAGEFEPIKLGGHKMVIKQVSEKKSQGVRIFLVWTNVIFKLLHKVTRLFVSFCEIKQDNKHIKSALAFFL